MKKIISICFVLLSFNLFAQKEKNGTVYKKHPGIILVESFHKAIVDGDFEKASSFLDDDFRIKNELQKEKLYRIFEVDYSEFLTDLYEKENQEVVYDKKNLLNMIRTFFQKINYPIDYNELTKLDLDQLVSTVSMIAPFSIEEKQKLIETVNTKEKIKTLEEIISFNLLDFQENKTVQ